MRKAVLLLLSIGSSVFGITEAELQAQIDTAIQAGGGEVVIPPGEVLISKGLVVKDAKNLRIIGYDAERSTLKLGAGAKVSLLILEGSVVGVSIEKLVFDGGGAEAASGTSALLQLAPIPTSKPEDQGIRVERCIFQNATGIGVHGSGISRCQIQICTFKDLGSAAVRLDGACQDVTVADCHMARSAVAVELVHTEGCTVTGIESRACGAGIFVGKSAGGAKLLRNAVEP
jgi:hypothetical protein